MKPAVLIWATLVVSVFFAPPPGAGAQGATAAAPGDPPIAALIAISAADTDGIVTIEGAAGSVFPAAQVAVRNLYTEEVVYVAAGITGTFSAQIYGPGNTPFHISPAPTIPGELRDRPGSLPGGPGTIIFGALPETQLPQELPITQLVVDGTLTDWENYPDAAVRGGFALQNQDAIYVATAEVPTDFARVQVQLTTETAQFDIVLNPRTNETATWAEQSDALRDLGTIAAAATIGEALELRVPLAPILDRLSAAEVTLGLSRVAFLDGDGAELSSLTFTSPAITQVAEQNGIVYLNSNIEPNPTRFSASGVLAGGASRWHARARVNTLAYEPGDVFDMEMDVRLLLPDLPPTLTGLALIGRFGLLPVSDERGTPISGGRNSNNGWSTVTTAGGLAIENVPTNFLMGEVVVPAPQVLRQDDSLVFGFNVSLPIPDGLPPGTYVPYFEGFGQVGDGVRFQWEENGLFGEGDGISRVSSTRLPVVLNIGTTQPEPKRLLWTLFHDVPSNGSRGIVAEQDQANVALANRVVFNSPTYIVPPSTRYDGEVSAYSLEPYVPNMLPNDYNSSAAPLVPLLFPNGRISASITRPDGTTDELSSTPIVQNALSTPVLDERTLFGENTQVDMYRLTTLNDLFTNQIFEQYGEYTVELSGFVEDIWGNRYEGGGAYSFTVAEMLDLTPMLLPGTPFEVGDVLHTGLHVSPGVVADVTVRVQVFPLDGSDVIEQTYDGTASAYGIYQPPAPFVFEVPGEYIVDYEARHTDADGRLWAGSLRTAGVIGTPIDELVLRGTRGIANDAAQLDPAWFFVEQLGASDSETALLNVPYHAGDVVWLPDSPGASLLARFALQDLNGQYTQWLRETRPEYTSPDGTHIQRLAARDALPNAMLSQEAATDPLIPFDAEQASNTGYTYVSFVRPGVRVRQFVLGGELGDVPLAWSPDDPLNGQLGAGFAGARPGDYTYLFGGGVVRNADANIQQSVIYGAFGTTIAADDPLGARVAPPYRGAAGGANGGELLTDGDVPVDMFFHPTGVRPGDVLREGDSFVVAGHVAPALASDVFVTITAPSGVVRQFEGVANAVGYFYSTANDFTADEIGVWTVQVRVAHRGRTSAGGVVAPFPSGGVLGAANATFSVYVVDPGADKLPWTQTPTQDVLVPPGLPFNATFDVPPGWTDVRRYLTVRFPSRVVQDGELTQPGGSLPYQYNPTALNQTYPFFEGNDGRVRGAASSDPLYLTFVFTGTNAEGAFDVAARQVVIRHDRLLTLE